MSKKNKDKQTQAAARLLGSITGGRNPDYDDAEGFQTLGATDEGKRKLDEVRLRRGKKASDTPAQPEPNTKRPYEDYDPSEAILLLSKAVNKVKDGKYGKAVKDKDSEIVSALIDAFLNMDHDLPNFSEVVTGITKMLRVCKSLYEYNANGKQFLDNPTYDRVLAKYRGYGYTEPTGIVSKAAKGKTGINYPTLHNNVDKAYCIRSGDPIPQGVKETGKIEDFLVGVYKTLSLSSETELELELSPKIDGVSANGTINGIQFTDPQTRGDENESVKIIGLDRLEVGDKPAKENFGLQYEVFVTNEDLIAASEYLHLERPYVSNRHAAAGIINRLCTKEDDEVLQFLSFYPIEAEGLDGMSYKERMSYLQNFAVVPKDMIDRRIIKGNLKQLLKHIEDFFEKLEDKREKLSYAIDGMVITVLDDDYQNTLGRDNRTNQYQIALKFDPAVAEAVVKGIHLDTGRKGFRTVQVDLKHPVFLDGVRYDHVPVLSAGLYEDMKLREGATVEVRRVGDVIPSITVLKYGDGKVLRLPEKCPDCGGSLIIKNKKLFCENGCCPGNTAGRINAFLDGLGLDGYGDSFADTLVSVLEVKSLADLFSIDEDMLNEHGLKDKIYRKFPDELRLAVRNTPDYVILGSIGIPDVGVSRAKALFQEASKMVKNTQGWKNPTGRGENNCWNHIWAGMYKEFLFWEHSYYDALGGAIGNKVRNFITTSWHKFLQRDVETIEKFINDFTVEMSENTIRMGHTGVEPNDKIKELCKKRGIEIVDGKSFDILLTADRNSNSDKMKKAKKKDLPVYTEDEFMLQYAS